MAEFEVREERDGLCHADGAVSLEDDVGKGLSRVHVADDHLG